MPMTDETEAQFWRRKHREAVDGANCKIAEVEAECERLLRLRQTDAWLETALLQLLHENGIEPSSSMLLDALSRQEGRL